MTDNVSFGKDSIQLPYRRFLADSAAGFVAVGVFVFSYYASGSRHLGTPTEVKVFLLFILFLLATPIVLPQRHGQQRRAESFDFLVQAARQAKIPLSVYLINRPRGGKGVKRTRRNGADTSSSRNGNSKPEAKSNRRESAPGAVTAANLVSNLPLEDMDETEQMAVWTLVKYLNRKEIAANDDLDDESGSLKV
jgi:hypothetical protein